MTPILQSSLEEAKQEGWQKGQQERQQVALSMLKTLAEMAFISEVTGLSIDEIKKLKKGSWVENWHLFYLFWSTKANTKSGRTLWSFRIIYSGLKN